MAHERTKGVRSMRTERGKWSAARTVIAGVLGLISGFVVAVALLDDGLGVEPLVIALAVSSCFAAAVAQALTRRKQ